MVRSGSYQNRSIFGFGFGFMLEFKRVRKRKRKLDPRRFSSQTRYEDRRRRGW